MQDSGQAEDSKLNIIIPVATILLKAYIRCMPAKMQYLRYRTTANHQLKFTDESANLT